MKIAQNRYESNQWKSPLNSVDSEAQLILMFGAADLYQHVKPSVREAYPHAQIVGCSTAGEIEGTMVFDDVLTLTAITFAKTPVEVVSVNVRDYKSSVYVAEALANKLSKYGLKHVLVLSDGLNINGTDLVARLTKEMPEDVNITGGLAGDADRFQKTHAWHNDVSDEPVVVAIGLYGDAISVGYGSMGGWDSFGPQRKITRSEENILYEIDDKSALALYKSYLGEYASQLPASGLLFPLSISETIGSAPLVRTIMAIDEEQESLTFAGDIPQGAYAQLMKANFDRLVDGASDAASHCQSILETTELAILISCVGRKMVLKQRIEEETEAVQEIIGDDVPMTGFYSYGEISPIIETAQCALHNQTMTITTLTENV